MTGLNPFLRISQHLIPECIKLLRRNAHQEQELAICIIFDSQILQLSTKLAQRGDQHSKFGIRGIGHDTDSKRPPIILLRARLFPNAGALAVRANESVSQPLSP